jgi:hypothetical protein
MPSNMRRVWAPKTQKTATQKKSASATSDEALRTLPLKENIDYDALRTMPFKQSTSVLSDDEDAMSTSAGSSSDLGLAESHSPSFAEAEAEEQNTDLQQIPRELLILHRKFVPVSAAPEYSLQTRYVAECAPVEPEVLVPPGVFVPPGFEDAFDSSKYGMFAVVAADTDELQSLLQKISLEPVFSSTSSSLKVAEDEVHLQDWAFESPKTASNSDSNNAPLQDWIFECPETASDSHWSFQMEYDPTNVADYVAEYVASLAATPTGEPLFQACGLNDNTGKNAVDIGRMLISRDKAGGPDDDWKCFDHSAMFKTGWTVEAEANQSFGTDCGSMVAASQFMAWPECYNGLCKDWQEHGAVPQASLECFSSAWTTFNADWSPSWTTGL